MAKRYRVGAGTRAVNWVFTRLTASGRGAGYRHLLTVRGRTTGIERTTPVDVMDVNGARWLVAGYGPSQWVANARAAGEVTLRRGKVTTRHGVRDAGPEEAVPVLRRYITEIRVTQTYFDAGPDASDAEVAAELPRHPVLRLTDPDPS